jgi:hypothetical protein
MVQQKRSLRMAAVLVLGAGLAGCAGGAETPPAAQDTTPAPTGSAGIPGRDPGAMHMDVAMMDRHAQEADSMVSAMRAHVDQMRQLPPEQQHARIGEHVRQVSEMLSMMDRHMREMGPGMPMDHAHMAEMMGMSTDDHGRMMEQKQTLRTEAEQLQTAPQPEVRQRMPEHLDRLERMLRMMEEHMAQRPGR